jgi:hypothetical protein
VAAIRTSWREFLDAWCWRGYGGLYKGFGLSLNVARKLLNDIVLTSFIPYLLTPLFPNKSNISLHPSRILDLGSMADSDLDLGEEGGGGDQPADSGDSENDMTNEMYDLPDDMQPFPIFPTWPLERIDGPVIGLVRADLDSIGCHGSSLGAVVYAIGVDDATWLLNSTTKHFKTNDKSRLYMKAQQGTENNPGWNPWIMGKKKKHIPVCLLPNLSLGRLKTIRGIEMFLTMYLLEEQVVRSSCFRHNQCAVVNTAFNMAKANYQFFPSFQAEDKAMRVEYALAMGNISRFATPSGVVSERGLDNCTQLFNADIGNIFFAIFWEAILDMGRDTPQCYERYNEEVNHGVSQLHHLSREDMFAIALDFRRTAFFSAQAAGTKNNWDASKTTTTMDLKDKPLFASTVHSLVEKTRVSALRFFNKPHQIEPPSIIENEDIEDASVPLASRRDALAVQSDNEDEDDEVEAAMGVLPFPPVDFKDRFFTFDIGVVIAPVKDQQTFLSNGRVADKIVANNCGFARANSEDQSESDLEETNSSLRTYVAPTPVFQLSEVADDGPFDGESFTNFYQPDHEGSHEVGSDDDSEVGMNDEEWNDDNDVAALIQPGLDPNDEHPQDDAAGGPELSQGETEEEETDPLEMQQRIRECKRIRYPKYGTGGGIGNSHKSMVGLTGQYVTDEMDPTRERICVTPEYTTMRAPKAVEGAQIYMNHLRIETMKRTRKDLFQELRYFSEGVTAAVTPALTENDRVKALKGFKTAALTMKKAMIAVDSVMEDARTADKKHVRHEFIFIAQDIRQPLTVPVNATTCCTLDAILVANQPDIYYFRKRWREEIMPGIELFFEHPVPPPMSPQAKASIICHAESLGLFLDAESAFLGRLHTALHKKYPRLLRISPPTEERVVLTPLEKRDTHLRYGVKPRNVPIPQFILNGDAQAARRYRVPAAEVELLSKQVRLPLRYATAIREVRLTLVKATQAIGHADVNDNSEGAPCPSLLDAPDFTALANMPISECQSLVRKWAKLLYYLYAEEHLALITQKANSLNTSRDVPGVLQMLSSTFPGGLPVRVSHADAIKAEFGFVSLPHTRSQNSSNVPQAVRNISTLNCIGKKHSPPLSLCILRLPY